MCHATNPEIWFRPNARISLENLLSSVCSGELIATPRIGARDKNHPKGYVAGQRVMLKVLGADGTEQLIVCVRVEELRVKPLRTLTKQDLRGTMMYDDWHQVQSDLSGFEGKILDGEDMVTIVAFSYVYSSITNKEKDYENHQVTC